MVWDLELNFLIKQVTDVEAAAKEIGNRWTWDIYAKQ